MRRHTATRYRVIAGDRRARRVVVSTCGGVSPRIVRIGAGKAVASFRQPDGIVAASMLARATRCARVSGAGTHRVRS